VSLLLLPMAVFAAQPAASALDDAVAAATSGSSMPPRSAKPPEAPGETSVHPVSQPPAGRDVRTLSEDERRRMMMFLFMRGATGRNPDAMMR